MAPETSHLNLRVHHEIGVNVKSDTYLRIHIPFWRERNKDDSIADVNCRSVCQDFRLTLDPLSPDVKLPP
jgi:hypothetical protein